MAIYIDPVTRQRVVYSKHTGDLVYDRTGDSAISEEVVPVIGNWTDYTGSAIINSRSQQMFAGLSNQLEGTDPAIKGAKLGDLDVTGNNKQTTRRRKFKARVNENELKTNKY